MRSTGIVRRVDNLGRIDIPSIIRKQLGYKDGTPIEMYIDGGNIILEEFKPHCIFCDETSKENLITFNGRLICRDCAERIIFNWEVRK